MSPVNFTRVKECEIWSLRPPVVFNARCGVAKEQHIKNIKHLHGIVIKHFVLSQTFCPSLPHFSTGSKSVKVFPNFGLSAKALQCRYTRRHSHVLNRSNCRLLRTCCIVRCRFYLFCVFDVFMNCVFLIFYISMQAQFDNLLLIVFIYPTALWLQYSINELFSSIISKIKHTRWKCQMSIYRSQKRPCHMVNRGRGKS